MRGGDAVGGRLRRALCVPGHRLRQNRRPFFHSEAIWHGPGVDHRAGNACRHGRPAGMAGAGVSTCLGRHGSGIAVVAALLAYEHSLVKPNDLSRMNAAFFTVNGYISLLFLLFWGAARSGRRA